jgi:hypothetical protein
MCIRSVFCLDRTPNTAHTGLVALDYEIAESAVLAALEAAGVPVVRALGTARDHHADLVLDVSGMPVVVQLKVASTVTPQSLATLVPRPRSESPLPLLVADRVVAAARDTLKQNGWSWLDLRGHLHVSGPGVLVDTPVPAWDRPSQPVSTNLFAGKVALEVACSLLMDPDRPRTVRQLARDLQHSPSSISVSLRAFRTAGLIDDGGAPVVPELFWELAPAWQPEAVDVARTDILDDPTIADALRTEWRAPESTAGWALADSLAAIAYGAPVVVPSDYPPDFYVPDRVTAHRAQTLLGEPTSNSTRGATIRTAPVSQVCARRRPPRSDSRWPLAHPLFVALDLAKDPGRGREVLEGWSPPDGVVRVW